MEDPCFPNPKKKDLENTRDNYKVDVEDAVNSIDLNDNQLFTNAIFKLQSTINITTLKKNKILFVSLFQLCVKNLKADNKKIEINTWKSTFIYITIKTETIFFLLNLFFRGAMRWILIWINGDICGFFKQWCEVLEGVLGVSIIFLKNFIILAWLGILEDFLKVPGVSIIWNFSLFIDLLHWVFLLLFSLTQNTRRLHFKEY